MAVKVWNRVLNSVVTLVASITTEGVICCGAGIFGELKDTYLLPNTVVALISAATFAGICGMYLGKMSRTNWAAGMPSRVISEIVDTRPICTPL